MNQRYDLLKCEKLDWENSENNLTELRLEMCKCRLFIYFLLLMLRI